MFPEYPVNTTIIVQTNSSVVRGSAISASPENLLDLQDLRPLPDLCNQNPHFNRIPRWFTGTSELGGTFTDLFVHLSPSRQTVSNFSVHEHHLGCLSQRTLAGLHSADAEPGRGPSTCTLTSMWWGHWFRASRPHITLWETYRRNCNVFQMRERMKKQSSC